MVKMRPERNRRPRVGRRLKGRGLEDGNQTGLENGGRGFNRTDNCRHPELRKNKK